MQTTQSNHKLDFNEGSNFDRIGQWAIAKYLGKYFIAGLIVNSRVKYGGKIQHTIVSDDDYVIMKAFRPTGTHFLVEEDELKATTIQPYNTNYILGE